MLHPQEALAGKTGLDDETLHICSDGTWLELEYVSEIHGELAAIPCLWVRRQAGDIRVRAGLEDHGLSGCGDGRCSAS